jgi:hypothetical protein
LTVIGALADFVVSAALVAVTVIWAGFGNFAGAVYRPVAEIVPTVASPPAVPLTFHVTAVLVVFPTVAENCWVWVMITEEVAGATSIVTEEGGGVGSVTGGADESPPQETINRNKERPDKTTNRRTYLMVFRKHP